VYESPTWRTWPEAARVVFYRPFLRRTVRLALLVGSILFLINHFDEVIRGTATPLTYGKGFATCLVPFCVSNYGILIGTRRRQRP
jgi:hypothetical protein